MAIHSGSYAARRISRCITAAIPAMPQWELEYGDFSTLKEYEDLRVPLQKKSEVWPTDLVELITERWIKDVGAKPYPINNEYLLRMRAANEDLKQLELQLDAVKLDVASSDGDLIDYAKQRAVWCTLYPHAAEFIVKRSGLKPPDGKKLTDEGKLLRMQDERWWRMKLRAYFGQHIENAMREKGLVCRTKKVYATDWAVNRRLSHKQNMAKAMKAATITSDAGEQLDLFGVVQGSVSNPSLRLAELATRSRGFEEIAKQQGHTYVFVTTTCPSAFHAMNYNKKQKVCYENKLYEGRTVRMGQAWQVKQWSKVRAKLKRKNIMFYGFRVAEPHHDGTVHWHMTLYCSPHRLDDLKLVISQYWLSEYADEEGAKKHRVVFKDRDDNNPAASPSAYLFKYLAKNINGEGIGEDRESGKDAITMVDRADAWASVHRIRQFQQLGGPPVTVWRELRRIRESVADETIEAARLATNKTEERPADFAAFINACGGIEVGRKTKVWTWKKPCQDLGRYREQKEIIGGVASALSKISTRLKKWVIKWFSVSASYLGHVAITVRSIFSEGNHVMEESDQKMTNARPDQIIGSIEWWELRQKQWWHELRGIKETESLTKLSLLWNR